MDIWSAFCLKGRCQLIAEETDGLLEINDPLMDELSIECGTGLSRDFGDFVPENLVCT